MENFEAAQDKGWERQAKVVGGIFHLRNKPICLFALKKKNKKTAKAFGHRQAQNKKKGNFLTSGCFSLSQEAILLESDLT